MRFKYYLRGCGFGIMFTAIMLTVAFHTRGVKEISNEEVIRRAEALGMVMPGEEEDIETPDDSGESQADGNDQPEEDEK